MADKVRTDLNSVSLVGTLIKDAELKTVGNGFNILTMGIANNYSQKKNDVYEQEVNFFDCRLFGKVAQALAPYMTKGTKVALCGKLRQERWEKDGKKNSKVYVFVEDIQFIGGKTGGNNNSNPAPQSSPVQSAPQVTGNDEGFPEDLPF